MKTDPDRSGQPDWKFYPQQETGDIEDKHRSNYLRDYEVKPMFECQKLQFL